MVIVPPQQTIFIHIPRTSGVAISKAIVEAVVGAVWCSNVRHIHVRRRDLNAFGGWKFFTVMRNPWELFASHYRWCSLALGAKGLPGVYARRMLDLGPEEGIRSAMMNNFPCEYGGWWQTFGGRDVEAILYEDEPYVRISEIFDVPLEVKSENESKADPVQLSTKLIEEIRQFCYRDIERFGYGVPEGLKIF